MTVTQKATVKVETVSFRAALAAVLPHAKRTKKDDDLPMHRVRCVFANGKMFVAATQGKTTALVKITYTSDSRGDLWEPDDGPMVVDLRPEQCRVLRQWLASKAVGDDDDMLVAITIHLTAKTVEFEAIGTQNAGEVFEFPLDEPHALFPDVVAISGGALAAAAGESERARTLVQDGKLVDLFKVASVQYGAPLRLRPTGAGQNAGWVVECGTAFVGTIASDNGGDEGVKRHAQWTQQMLTELAPLKLVSA